jgi:NADH-quinone oxidoreductase subunit F
MPGGHGVVSQDFGADSGRQGQTGTFQLLLDLSDNMTGKTICVLSDSCAAPIVSGIQKFRQEFEAYIQGAREPALAAV